MMSRKTHRPGTPDWLKVVICLTVVIGAAAGAGHVADGSAPTTACVELQAFGRRSAWRGRTLR